MDVELQEYFSSVNNIKVHSNLLRGFLSFGHFLKVHKFKKNAGIFKRICPLIMRVRFQPYIPNQSQDTHYSLSHFQMFFTFLDFIYLQLRCIFRME